MDPSYNTKANVHHLDSDRNSLLGPTIINNVQESFFYVMRHTKDRDCALRTVLHWHTASPGDRASALTCLHCICNSRNKILTIHLIIMR